MQMAQHCDLKSAWEYFCIFNSAAAIAADLRLHASCMDRMIEVAALGKSVDHGDIPRKAFT